MVTIREFTPADDVELQKAISNDTFHSEWKVEHFHIPDTTVKVIEDSKGPIAFVLYTDTRVNGHCLLRISCVWASTDVQRNARAIIHGVRDAVEHARVWDMFEGVVIETAYPNLANFLVKVMGFRKLTEADYVLYIKETTLCAAPQAQ